MADVTIYKPPSVTVRLVGGKYVIENVGGLTVQAINGEPPVPEVVLVNLEDGARVTGTFVGDLVLSEVDP